MLVIYQSSPKVQQSKSLTKVEIDYTVLKVAT